MAGLDDMSLDQLLALRDQTLKGDPDVSAIHQIESSGASDAQAGITNPASSALGSMQVLAGTRRDPGYGVTPSSGTPQDDARTGRDYYAALRSKYSDSSTAALAYSWGPGNVDHWLANGADLNALPLDQLDYLRKFTVKHPNSGQTAQQSAPALPAVAPGQPTPQPARAPGQAGADSGFLSNLGAGASEGLADTILGGQALVGKGLSGLGATNAGDFLTSDAQARQREAAQTAQQSAGDSMGRTIGSVIGGVAPALLLGPEVIPQIAAGGLMSGGSAALSNQPIAPAIAEGAGLGAAGALGGQLIGAGAAAARPLATRAFNAVRGNDAAATARIANELGPDLDSTIASLDANSNEIVPDSLPTAAGAGRNTKLTAIQRRLQNTAQGQVAFTDRFNADNAARWNALNSAVGPDLANEADAFTQAQAARVAQGQTELPPISQAQADIMQSPQYRAALKAAPTLAENRGSTVFEDQQAPLLDDLRQGIENVAGTPGSIEALRTARGNTADQLFGATDVSVPTSWPEFGELQDSRTFKRALTYAEGASSDLGEGPIISTDPHGGGTWVSGKALLHAKQFLDEEITSLVNNDKPAQARPIISVRDKLVGLMDRASLDYAPARAQFAADSAPIDAQQALQTRLNGTVDPITGAVSPNRLRQTINSVVGEQMKSGPRAADAVSDAMLDQLRALSQEARRTPTNLTGLPGEGQEFLRQGLQGGARPGSSNINAQEATQAAQAFDQYLGNNSASYRQFLDQAGTTGEDIRSRQQLSDALEQLMLSGENTAGDPKIELSRARSLLGGQQPITGNARTAAKGVIADLQRASATGNALGAAGSQTVANAQLGGGLLGEFLKTGGAATAGGVVGGIPGAALGVAVRVAIAKVAQKTEKATIDLLLNPKKLAAALREFKNQPQAKQAFIDALKQKATGAGRAGVRAVQAFEAGRTQNGEKRQ